MKSHSADFDLPLLVKLIALKAVTLLVSCLVVLATYLYFKLELPYQELSHTLCVSAFVIVLWLVRLKIRVPVSELEIFVLLVSDVVILSLLVDQTGGSANPFTSSLLIPLALSAALLRKRYSLSAVLVAVLVYANWTFGGDSSAHMNHSNFSLHLYGMWINFLISAAILFLFITYAMDSVRSRESQLQNAREKILRDEQLVAVATLTATTAHALGSPLSTMAILVEEWEREGTLDDERRVFKEQLMICKKYLAGIGTVSRGVEVSQKVPMNVREFFIELRHYFHLLHPEENVSFAIDPAAEVKNILQNRSFLMGLVNLIENSLQSGGDRTSVKFINSDDFLKISILDNGAGLSSAVKNKMGKPFMSTKTGGWGLGVYLSNSTIEQFGGEISMHDGVNGGTETTVDIAFNDTPGDLLSL